MNALILTAIEGPFFRMSFLSAALAAYFLIAASAQTMPPNADAASPVVSVRFGDSITAGVGATSDTRWEADLQKLRTRQIQTINEGVGGRTLATGGLFPYFPSNGGLLYAAAMMAAGWDGAPKTHAPGFPSSQWTVRSEGLSRAL